MTPLLCVQMHLLLFHMYYYVNNVRKKEGLCCNVCTGWIETKTGKSDIIGSVQYHIVHVCTKF